MRRFRLSFFVFLIAAALIQFTIPLPASRADTFHPVVRGKRGVVAGGHPLSVEAGLRILQHGGNAVDAGVATILAASVIEFSHFSFGGEVPILIKLRGSSPTVREGSNKNDDVVVVEGMGQAPMKATREFFANRTTRPGSANESTAPDSARAQAGNADMPTMAGAKSGLIPSTGPLAATVPAVLDACVTALDRFGTKSLAEVMQPERGHKVNVQSAWGTLSSPTVIIYNPQNGVSSAGADPRRGRYAVAW